MDNENFSRQVKKELEEITRRKGFLLESKTSDDRVSLEIIDEFLKCNRGQVNINKNLLSALLLICNNLVSESVKQLFRELEFNFENKLIINLYMNLQMSSNFLDGFFLGYSFIKIMDRIDILEKNDLDILEIFKRIFMVRMNREEIYLIKKIDNQTGLINHFRQAYRDLFLSNSVILKDLVPDKAERVVHYLMLAFFDGILTAKIISDNPQRNTLL